MAGDTQSTRWQVGHGSQSVLARVANSMDRSLSALGLSSPDEEGPRGWSARQLINMRNSASPAIAGGFDTNGSARGKSAAPAGSATTSLGGRCRMIRCRSGWAAIHLARELDIDSVPAIVAGGQRFPDSDSDRPEPASRLEQAWTWVEAWAANETSESVAGRCHLLDVPAAVVPAPPEPLERPEHSGPPPGMATAQQPFGGVRSPADGSSSGGGLAADLGGRHQSLPVAARVIDTTALWAGPLTARLLGDLGARVFGNPDPTRPDPTTTNDPDFYRVLHHHHRASRIDPATELGRAELHSALSPKSDPREIAVVLFAARRRALERLGISPATLLARHKNLLVVTLTAYGFEGPGAERSGLGDDVAAAAGAVDYRSVDRRWWPGFVGDALADPVTGVHAAKAIVDALATGQRGHLALSMFDAMQAAMANGNAGTNRNHGQR